MTPTDVVPLLGRLPVVLEWAEEGTDVVADAMSTHRRRLAEAMSSLLERVDELARSSDHAAGGLRRRCWRPPGPGRTTGRAGASPWHRQRRGACCGRGSVRTTPPCWVAMALASEAATAANWGCARPGALVSARRPPRRPRFPPRGAGADAAALRRRWGAGRWRDGERPAPGAPLRRTGHRPWCPGGRRSPLARTVHMTPAGGVADAWPEFDEASLRQVGARLDEALAGLRATSGVAAALVETFTLVVVVRGPGRGFGHGSTVVDLGRTVIMVPSAACVTPARLTEAEPWKKKNPATRCSEKA